MAVKTINELAPIDLKKLRPLSTLPETTDDLSEQTDLLIDQNQTYPEVTKLSLEKITQTYHRSYSSQGFLSAKRINSNQIAPIFRKTTETGWGAD